MTVITQLAVQRIVPVIRSAGADDAIATARACARAGVRVVELTRTVPDVERALLTLAGDGLTLGVGTITDAGQVDAVADAGARFVVSFANPRGFVERARDRGVSAVPGAFTPSEFAAAAAAPAVKLFPARLSSPGYLRDLRAVLGARPVMVTGGIGIQDIAAWLRAGALAVGLGGELGTVARHGAEEVERRTRAALTRAEEIAA